MCIHSLVTGCDTPQYRAVLDNLVTLVKAIEATPGSLGNLQTEFIAKSWFGPTAKPDANDLAILALNKIENNVKNYDMFTEILSSVTGMKQIVDIIKGLLSILESTYTKSYVASIATGSSTPQAEKCRRDLARKILETDISHTDYRINKGIYHIHFVLMGVMICLA